VRFDILTAVTTMIVLFGMFRHVDGQNCSDVLGELTLMKEAAEFFEATHSERE
jgi:hypothetical protein